MTCLLGVDFGGGASKATLLRADGTVAAEASAEYPTAYLQPGYAQQQPSDWYAAACHNIRVVLEKSGVQTRDIAAVALDAATHTAVLCDAQMQVLHPAIHWTDNRSTEQAAFLRQRYGGLIGQQTLHEPDTIWTLPQLLWMKENRPDVWRKTRRILFAKDYVRYCFTGGYATDYIEAQGSMLFDYGTMDWSPALCGILGFPAELLPPVLRPADIAGALTVQAARDTGLQPGTPVVCGTTDTVMEVFASGAIAAGQMTVKLATAGRICVVTEKPYAHRHLINYSHVADGLWYPGTATKSCAASYRWYRDTFGENYRALDDGAQRIEPGAQGLFFHPYLSGELTPYADPLLRGSFTGITAGHTKAHFSRAVLEGGAFSLLDCQRVLDEIGLPHEASAAVIGGGAASPLWRQITADMLGITLRQNETTDSSFGSAMLAGVASGVFGDLADAVKRCVRPVSFTRPQAENTARYAALFPLYRQIHDALAPVYQKMAAGV